MDAPFVHLDVRSCFSLKEGAFTPEQLVARAAALGMPAVALTDRDGLYGAARFVAACETAGVQPILGASLTVRAPTPPPGDAHVVLLANDADGLCEPLPAAHRRAPARGAGRPVGRDRADLRARGRAHGAARPALPSRSSRGRRPRRRGGGASRRPIARRSAPTGAWSPSSIGSRPARPARSAPCSGSPSGSMPPRSPRTPFAIWSPPTRSSPTRWSACAASCRSPRQT